MAAMAQDLRAKGLQRGFMDFGVVLRLGLKQE
jgi:hypothetical protein